MACSLIPAFFIFLSSSLTAGLIDRGIGVIYDDDLDVSWLQDANYALTSGYTLLLPDPPPRHRREGRMPWYQASEWASQLQFAGFDDWTLPTQEMLRHLHYDELGLLLYSDPNWTPGNENAAPFFNVGGNHYWSSEPGLTFNFKEGTSSSNASLDGNLFHALAIRFGDTAIHSVPEPSTMTLLAVGAGAAIGRRYRNRKWKRPPRE